MATESPPPPQPKRMGRPRLSSPERRQRILASKAKWRDANREYYRAQINRLSGRPEYKARRKELRAKARGADNVLPTGDLWEYTPEGNVTGGDPVSQSEETW